MRPTPHPRTILLVALLWVLASCQGGGGTVVHHPTPDNIPQVTDPRFILRDAPQDTLFWLENALHDGYTIGMKEGPAQDMIGQVRDVVVSDSLIYYLDGSFSQIRAYDFEGRLVDVFGGPGDGPGEFDWPIRIAAVGREENKYVVVASYRRSTLSVFRKASNSDHQLRSSFRAVTSFVNGDMCAMNGHIYTTGYAEDIDGVIHKHTLDGKYVLSFGARYNHSDPFIRNQMAHQITIECNTTHDVLLYLHPRAPIASGFSPSGKRMWRIRFEDARMVPIEETIGSDGLSSVTSLWPRVVGESTPFSVKGGAHGDSFWLARHERLSEEDHRYVEHYYRLDASSGTGEYLGIRPRPARMADQEWKVIRTLSRNQIVASWNAPFPQLGIYSLPNAPQ